MVHKLPDDLSYEQGALVEPAAVALHSVRQAASSGDMPWCFVRGRWFNDHQRVAAAVQIYAVKSHRRAKAEVLGAMVVDVKNAVEKRALSGGGDVAFEVTGIPAVLTKRCAAPTRGRSGGGEYLGG